MTDLSRPILCLGEAIVDLICERYLDPGETPAQLVPHHGGALANVAAAVAKEGVPTALIGGVGSDHWGAWLLAGLRREGVSTEWVATLKNTSTPLAIALFDSSGEPSFEVYGENIGPTMSAAEQFLKAALAQSQALIVGSNTMVGAVEREVTRRAVELARAADVPILLDPNHRPARWQEQKTAVDFSLELARDATILKCNREEALLLTGKRETVEAARALSKLGPELVVITDRHDKIVTAGAVEECWAPDATEVTSALGAGDAFMGSLAAGLARSGWDFSRTAEVLPQAAAAGSASCRHWGARA